MKNSVIDFLRNSRGLPYSEEVVSVSFGLAFIEVAKENSQLSKFSVKIRIKLILRKFGSARTFSIKEDNLANNSRITSE